MIAQSTTVRRIAAGLAVAATLATSACAAGQRAETSEEKPTLDGTNANVGNIALRDIAIVTPDAANYSLGSNPQVRLVIVNNSSGTDRLTSISTPDTTGWGTYANDVVFADAVASATSSPSTTPTSGTPTSGAPSSSTASSSAPTTGSPADSPVTLTRGVAVSYGVPAAGGRLLALLGSTKVLYPGTTVAVTFTFAKAGSTTVQVPIELSDSGSYTPAASYVPGQTESEGPAEKEEGH